jgi:hypothetical protein
MWNGADHRVAVHPLEDLAALLDARRLAMTVGVTRVLRSSLTRRTEAALHAVAALYPPPAAKTTRKVTAATGHSRTRQARAG